MYTYGFDICAKLCHFSSVDVHVVGMSMLEYSTAVRQWELVYLSALSSGILVIKKKESTGEGKVHTLELTCIVHKHTQTENRRQLHGWFSPTLLLQVDSKMQIQDCVQFWVGGLEETCLELSLFSHLFAALIMPTFSTWEESCLTAACYLWWYPACQHGECLPGELPHVILELYRSTQMRNGGVRYNYSQHWTFSFFIVRYLP